MNNNLRFTPVAYVILCSLQVFRTTSCLCVNDFSPGQLLYCRASVANLVEIRSVVLGMKHANGRRDRQASSLREFSYATGNKVCSFTNESRRCLGTVFQDMVPCFAICVTYRLYRYISRAGSCSYCWLV